MSLSLSNTRKRYLLMNVYFLRHGVAVEPDRWRGRDFDRPLTPEGIERMEREANAIALLSLGLEKIVTSPLLRAKQTAEIVAERLDMRDALVEDRRLGDGFDLEKLSEILAEHESSRALMVVGHEPTFSLTIGRLIGRAYVEVKKGALAGVELADAWATTGLLTCLIPPKALKARS